MIELPAVERMIEDIAGYTTGKTVSTICMDDPEVVELDGRHRTICGHNLSGPGHQGLLDCQHGAGILQTTQ